MINKQNMLLAILVLFAQTAIAQKRTEIDVLMGAVKSVASEEAQMSVVRKTILREAATTLGARAGMSSKGCAIKNEIELRANLLDRRFRFSELLMGKGLLPPVISEAVDSVALTQKALRWSSKVYTLDEPARLVVHAPTWRDWLYVGLPLDKCGEKLNIVNTTISSAHRPANVDEEEYFKKILAQAYDQGVETSQVMFETNLARLDRAYTGMRNYFDLYQRGIVSAPIIVSNTDVVNNDDPNVLLIGDTLIRISLQPTFVARPEEWIPLSHENNSKAGQKGRDINEKMTFTNVRREILSEVSPGTFDHSNQEEIPLKKWEIRKDDETLSSMLERWAAVDGWKIVWSGAQDVQISGTDSIYKESFYEAASYVIDLLRSAGANLYVSKPSDSKVLLIRSVVDAQNNRSDK